MLLSIISSFNFVPHVPAQPPTEPTTVNAATSDSTVAAKKTLVINRINGPLKARLLAALAGIAIFGICIVALAWLGGRMTRRMLKTNEEQRQRYLTTEQLTRDDWADKPLTYEERQRIFARRHKV